MRVRSAVAGTTTLLVLLTAGAAQSLSGTNTVYSDDIVSGAVTNSDLAASAVTSNKIAAGGVTSSDIRQNAVSGSKVLDASIASADLAPASVGRSKLDFAPISNVVRVEQATAVSGGQPAAAVAICPGSSPVVLGGGLKWGPSGEAGFTVWSSFPFKGGWNVFGQNVSQQSKNLTVYAICASEGPAA